ncbi:MAG TPA: chromosomal replication initiator protein DnaA [Acidimicrobiales bacterium]|nr:chromosomal replication initiator protein DnaA [Acidimicrobiales bacterium]
MTDVQELWESCGTAIRTQLTEATWKTWFAGVRPLGVVNNTLVLAVPNTLVRDRLESRFSGLLREALVDVGGTDISVRFEIQADDEKEVADGGKMFSPSGRVSPEIADEALASPTDGGSSLNPRYSFDGFVIGASNRFAHAAALSVAEAPARAYNPLFIIGATGLGKTHLLQAIRNYVTENFPRLHVRYVSTETFMNEFVEAIRNNTTGAFKRHYRQCDVLLIDDIQFLEGKESLQEEFFHTFNSLHDASKQLVLTSDRPPGSIATLESRLRSRFLSGLTADVQPPELETRIAILRSKSEHERVIVPDDVLEFIASNIKDNIRELEGALNRVIAYANLTHQPLTRELAENVLADVIAGHQPRRITAQHILAATSEHFGFDIEEICGPSRRRPLVNARQVSMYVFRDLTDFSYPAIAREFGGRDHTTVIHAVDKISGLMRERRQIYEQVTELITKIRNGS